MRFVEGVYRETGAYPAEVVLPLRAWFPLQQWAENVCRFEAPTEDLGGAIVLAQGTKVRLAVPRHGEEKT